jgi:trk system potassium uptake protein TrkA
MTRRLLPEGSQTEWVDPSGTVRLAEMHVHRSWVGRTVVDLEAAAGARVAFITRYGDGVLPGPGAVLQEGDLVHVLMRVEDSARVAEVFETVPEVQD